MDYTEAKVKGYKSEDMLSLVKERSKIKAKIKSYDDSLKLINEDLMAHMQAIKKSLGEKKITCEGWSVVLSESVRSSIKVEKLLEKGVSTSIIKYATVETPVTSLRVGEIKSK